MKTYPTMIATAVSLGLVLLGLGNGGAEDLPTVKGKKIVASVQGEPITLEDLERQRAPEENADRRVDLARLKRMIDLRLIVQEARRMELDRLPEIRQVVESFSRVTLREELVERITQDVKADRKEVEKVYQDAVAELRMSAALFEKEEHANRMATEAKANGDFGALARKSLAEGHATKVEEGVLVRRRSLDPAIGRAIDGLAAGSVSPVVSVKSGFLVVKLEDVHYKEDPAVRAEAERIVLTARKRETVAAFDRALKEKYARVNSQLLKSLDYESPTPGMDALLKDRRVLAEIKGEKPVTVAELTEALKFKFFHGTALAAERKRLNARKEQVLDGLLHRKLFREEALRLKLDKADSYRRKVSEYEDSVLFDAFLRKAIAPDVKLEEAEIQAYYDRHREDYSSPEMMGIRSLAFEDRTSAATAGESLQKGADFQWVAGHADGQISADTKGILSLNGKLIMTTELPDGIRKAVAGAKPGDVRLYPSPEKHFYVLVIERVVGAAPQPFEQVRGEIVAKVVAAKVQEAVEAFAEKLRALSDVRVYLKGS